MERARKTILLSVSGSITLCLLAACGGGGGSSAGGPTNPIVPSVAAPAVTSSPVAPSSISASPDSAAVSIYTQSSSTTQAGLSPSAFQSALADPTIQSIGSTVFADTFNSGKAPNWTTLAPTFTVCNPTLSSTYEFCGNANGGEAIAVAGSSSWTDYRVQSWIRLANSSSGAALLARVKDSNNFYQLELRSYNNQNSWFVWKKVNGQYTEIAGGAYPYVVGTYYRLRLDLEGNHITASISPDGKTYTQLGTGTDTTFTQGQIGLRVWGGALASFDNVTVSPITSAGAVVSASPTAASSSSPTSTSTASPSTTASASPHPTITASPTPSGTAAPSVNTASVSVMTPVAIPNSVTPAGRTFYVSPSGNDNNAGTSPATAWQTIGKAESYGSQPGDTVLFEGGQTFQGSLNLSPGHLSSTTASNPVTVSSYGTGQATIQTACNTYGIYIHDTGGVHFNNLNFVGCQSAESSGVMAYDDSGVQTNISFDHDTFSYYTFGFELYGNGSNVFNGISITNNEIHDMSTVGVLAGAGTTNTYVGHNEVYNVSGWGYGIYFDQTNGGLAEYNCVHDVGGSGAAYGQGISGEDSSNLAFQYNEVYHIYKGSNNDDNNIIFDGGTNNSVAQYNYLHDSGDGVSLTQWNTSSAYLNNVVRYNLIVNNGEGMWVGGQTSTIPANGTIYNNTFIIPNGGAGMNVSSNVGTLDVYNNAFIGASGTADLGINPSTSNSLSFLGNGYYSSSGPFSFSFQTSGNVAAASYSGLSAFQKGTGEEESSSAPVGIEANPLFNGPSTAPIIGITNIDNLASLLTSYRLPTNSPFYKHGVNLQNPGPHDFWGNAIVATDIGA